MIKAYINYPNPHVTAHCDPNCGNIQAQQKSQQRYCLINISTISTELDNFYGKRYSFAANSEYNDMWLEINFHDQAFELNILEYICRLLGKNYSPFLDVEPGIHC